MIHRNSLRILCFIWPAAFVHMHVCLLFITIWVYSWDYVSYECHSSSVTAEAKLKTSAWCYFVYFCVVNFLPQIDDSWISAITHNPFSGTAKSFIKPPTGHLYVAVLHLPKHVMSETELIFYLMPPTQLLFIQCCTFSLIILSFTQFI